MGILLQELKKFVTLSGWTYAVIWKIGRDHRTPVWHQSYFNELEEREIGQAQRFEDIYRRCQFTAVRPGYAYLAWQRQLPYWWTRQLMEPIPTDENKELFLAQAKIQTIVCFPGRAPADGSGFCIELASTSPVMESEYLKAPIRDFMAASIAPHLASSSHSLPPEAVGTLQVTPSTMSPTATMAAMAAVAAHQQDSAIITDIASQAALYDEESIAEIGNIAGANELYHPWTMSTSLHVSVGLSSYPVSNYPDYNYPNIDISPFFYNDSSPILEPFPPLGPTPDWSPGTPSSDPTPHGSRKGKETLVGAQPPGHHKTTQSVTQTLTLVQQKALEKLRSAPASLAISAQESSKMVVPPPGYPIPTSAGLRTTLPGHSPRSLFQPHRHAQFPRFGGGPKRESLIVTWKKTFAPQIIRIRGGMPGPGSVSAERRSSFDDPRSSSDLAHDHKAAELHKIAERERRSKLNRKLRTLISIVPIIDKKDKVSVLSSTIEYIRQLTSRISSFENSEEAGAEAAPATTSRMEEPTMSMDRDFQELAPPSTTDSAGAGPSSSGGPIVVVEGSSDGETWLIKVQATHHSRSLIRLLNVFHELGLEVVSVDYRIINGRFRANVYIKNVRDLSSSELKEALCRVLESSVESSPNGSE